MEVRKEIEFTKYLINMILSIERELGCNREEASARFKNGIVFHFDRADPHSTSTHPTGSEIRMRALSSTEEEWRAFLVPVEDRDCTEGTRFR